MSAWRRAVSRSPSSSASSQSQPWMAERSSQERPLGSIDRLFSRSSLAPGRPEYARPAPRRKCPSRWFGSVSMSACPAAIAGSESPSQRSSRASAPVARSLCSGRLEGAGVAHAPAGLTRPQHDVGAQRPQLDLCIPCISRRACCSVAVRARQLCAGLRKVASVGRSWAALNVSEASG